MNWDIKIYHTLPALPFKRGTPFVRAPPCKIFFHAPCVSEQIFSSPSFKSKKGELAVNTSSLLVSQMKLAARQVKVLRLFRITAGNSYFLKINCGLSSKANLGMLFTSAVYNSKRLYFVNIDDAHMIHFV